MYIIIKGIVMYKIEKTPFGFRLTFGGFLSKDELEKWVAESQKALASKSGKFGILVDMRTLKPLPPDVQKTMENGQKLYKGAGMERSAVVLNNAVTTMQFRRIVKETGIYQWERYVDASKVTNFEQVCTAWITKGVDPDK